MKKKFIIVVVTLTSVLVLVTATFAQEKPLQEAPKKLPPVQPENPAVQSQLRQPRTFHSATGAYLGAFYGQFFGLGGRFNHWIHKPYGFEATLGMVSITEDRLYYNRYPYSYGGYVSHERGGLLVSLYVGLKKPLLLKDFDSNFRLYWTMGLGPVLGLEYTDRYTFPRSLWYSRTLWSLSEFIGIGADYISGRWLFNLDVRYYLMRFQETIIDKKNYDGLAVMFGFAKMF